MNSNVSLGRQLRRSRQVDINAWSEHASIKGAAEFLYHKVLKQHWVIQRERAVVEKQSAITMLLCNLYAVHNADPRFWVSLSLDHNAYGHISGRYKPDWLTWRHIDPVVEAFALSGLVEMHKGFIDRNKGTGRVSRMRATDDLILLLETQFGVQSYMVMDAPAAETLLLRDADKKLTAYADTDWSEDCRDRLRVIRDALFHANYNLKITDQQEEQMMTEIFNREDRLPIDFTHTLPVRIFNNGNFGHGGRFYRHWGQGIPKVFRPHIVHDGKPTVEIDYSAMHPTMLYAEAGREMPAAPYQIDGFEIPGARSICKRVFNTMVNARTPQEALGSIANSTLRGMKLPERYPTPKALMDALLDKHREVSHLLNSNAGVRLQYRDAQIAETVMLEMLKYGVAPLPIHDSFIVRSLYSERLLEVMSAVFEQAVGVSATAKGDQPLFDIVPVSDVSVEDQLEPVQMAQQFEDIRNQQLNGTSAYKRYEVRNANHFERIKI